MSNIMSLILKYMDSVRSVVSNNTIKHYLFTVSLYSSSLSCVESVWPFCTVELCDGLLKAEYMVRPDDLDNFLLAISESGLFSERKGYMLTLRFNGFADGSGYRELIVDYHFSDKGKFNKIITHCNNLGDRVISNNMSAKIFVDTCGADLNKLLTERIECLS